MQVTPRTRFLWRPASHGPSQHMSAAGTLACQRESGPGHPGMAKGRHRHKGNKTELQIIQQALSRCTEHFFFCVWRQWEHEQFTQPGSFAWKLKSLYPGDFLKSCRCSLTCFPTNIFPNCREGWEMGPKSTWAHQRMLWRTWLQRSQCSDTSQHRRVLKNWKK